jgi:Family of unknown function (DUF6510)
MDEHDLRLDGNAAAGVMSEIFAREMTTAIGTCANCGKSGPFGATHVYMAGPGTVVRCPYCEWMLMCVVQARDRIVVNSSGIQRMELR